jgi:hypothetical protein
MCEHHNFSANVSVARLEDTGRFLAHVTVFCTDCSEPFQFAGLPAGLHLNGATVSLDGLEARLAICPKSSQPSPFQLMATGFTVSH